MAQQQGHIAPRLSNQSSTSLPAVDQLLSARGTRGNADFQLGNTSCGPRQSSSLQTSAIHPKHQALADAYLSELLSCTLERLKKEPELLKDERQQLERTLQTTAVSQYGAFIETSSCLETISSELSAVGAHLDLLLQGIPQLATSCEAFVSKSGQVLEAFAQNKQLASHQSALLELLEVPQLMDTCVRNGVYDEALELQAFVSRMALLHTHVPLVKMLTAQVTEVSQSMLQQLLARLKTGLQLPECLRLMGYLRRMGAFNEADLRLHFLQCRDEWISGLVEELDESSDPYEYLKHLTDVHRVHLFDAVMQYRAIFFDGTATAVTTTTAMGPAVAGPGAGGLLGGAAALPQAMQDPAALAASVRESSMLQSWVQHRVSLYLKALARLLPTITQGANLASLLEHCTYCGSSLARVGLDFQGLLLPLFESCSLSLLAQHLSQAIEHFSSRLELHKWVTVHSSLLHKARPAAAAAAAGSVDASINRLAGGASEDGASAAPAAKADGVAVPAQGGEGVAGAGQADVSAPPYVLMEHLPLAVFANGVLAALNEVRQCALQSCARPAAGLLQQALEQAAASLMHFRATHVLSHSEAPQLLAATKMALDVLLPYVAACYARVFHGAHVKLDVSSAAGTLRTVLQEA